MIYNRNHYGLIALIAIKIIEYRYLGCIVMQALDFTAVAKAHADWKVKLRQAIENKEQVDVETLAMDNVCMLGKWLYDEGTQQQLAGIEAYRECVHNHAHFHLEAAKVAREINRGNYDRASELLTLGHPYAQASADVAMSLHELRREVVKRQG